MIKKLIHLTELQCDELNKIKEETGITIAALVRKSVDAFLAEYSGCKVDELQQKQKAFMELLTESEKEDYDE